MNRAVRLVLGIGTILSFLILIFFAFSLLLFFVGVVSLADAGPRAQPSGAFVVGFVFFYISIILLALVVSGLNMGYSFHMAWNESISPKARGLWTLALWFFGVFAMPFYWFKHLMHDPEPADEVFEPTPTISRQNAIILGVLTIVPVLLMAVGFVFFAIFFGVAMADLENPRATGASVIGSLTLIGLAYVILIGALLISSVVMFIYGYLNAANSRVQPTYRGVWAIGMLLMPYFVIPAYWFLEIWMPATNPSLPSGGIDLNKSSEPSAASAATIAAATVAAAKQREAANPSAPEAANPSAPEAGVQPADITPEPVVENAPAGTNDADAGVVEPANSPSPRTEPPTAVAPSIEPFPADPGEAGPAPAAPERFPRDPEDAPGTTAVLSDEPFPADPSEAGPAPATEDHFPADPEDTTAIPLPPAQVPPSETPTHPEVDPPSRPSLDK